jgi:hypothetical protein
VTHPADDSDPFAQTRARNRLVQTIRESLKGRRLDIRERRSELVIADPGHPEHGRVHINLASGEASHACTFWTYLGRIEGHGTSRDPYGEPQVNADVITGILTGPDSPQPGDCPQ